MPSIGARLSRFERVSGTARRWSITDGAIETLEEQHISGKVRIVH